MKFTLSWLKDYLQTDADLPAILDAMTRIGLEVEHVHDPREALKSFTVCRVVSAAQHPNADKLQVCQVDTVDGRLEIVCGGLNARPGLVTAYAPIGAYIPGSGITLVPKPVRGIVSNGMLCSGGELDAEEDPFRLRVARFEDWYPRAQVLGLDEDQAIADGGILELPDDLEVGMPIADALGASDPVIDFEVTPNRPDWLGVAGIARDLAAAGLGTFKLSEVAPVDGKFPCPVSIKIEAPEACPVFAGRLIRGVKNGPSPDWMQKRLKAIGVNPKNLLVDVTNYVSFDRCRPLHVYDAKLLKGGIVARMGGQADTFEALDNKTYADLSGMCVIADDGGKRTIGLGGVMGGTSTGSSIDTVDVFLEAAWFDPNITARTGRTTGILSDARFRFERGVDPASHLEGIELATRLIIETGGGEASVVEVAGEAPKGRDPVSFRPADMKRLTGVDMKPDRMEAILRALGFDPAVAAPAASRGKKTQDVWLTKVPTFRPDIEGSADLVEELIRIEGFDALPDEPLPPLADDRDSRVVVTPLQSRVRIARRVLAARGYLEAVTWSFMNREKAALAVGANALRDTLTLDNPIASDLDYMRPTILANLAEAAQRNADHGATQVRLFETGPVYPGDQPKDQRMQAAAVIWAPKQRHWSGATPAPDAFTAKADLFALLDAMGQDPMKFQIGEPAGPHWHPGRSATLKLGPKNTVGAFGELHPAFLKALAVDGPMLALELDIGALPVPKTKGGKTKPVLEKADLTPVRRDFAFVVEEAVAAGEIVRLAQKADPKLIAGVSVFDVYRGAGVEDGKKSVAIEVTLQPKGEAMTDAQIDTVASAIIAQVSKGTGATLRG
ncbi:MAG: phenylalanine--tRNA ligase subunit beta [Hyphomonadaceae bacterium]